jgi:Bacterial transglutaminase-like N-terminal region
MSLLTVHHSTVYRYREPVGLGEHRMLFRPRESYDLRLIQTKLRCPARTVPVDPLDYFRMAL